MVNLLSDCYADQCNSAFFGENPVNKFALTMCFAVALPAFGQTEKPSRLPSLPNAVTSFGAATTVDGHLYVYGGHMGDAHKYYKEGQSHTLLRLNLAKPTKWEKLVNGPGLQGLALVTDGKVLYRVGGFRAMNTKDEDSELRSQASFAKFDPRIGKWEELTPLPGPRSSFDAVVHRDQLFVVGGWDMQPEGKNWCKQAYVANLKQTPIKWQKLPDPPFQRRALSLAAVGDSIYAIGGMKEKGGPTKEVSVFNIKTQKWSVGPELIGEEAMAGFGSSSFAIGKRLFTSTYEGKVLELSPDGKKWKQLLALEEGRFFHRMVPMNKSALLLISGANMETGKYDDIVIVPIDGSRKTAKVR